jgi:hypothetical protein
VPLAAQKEEWAMASSLLDELKGLVTPQLLNAAAARWGESEIAISKGLSGAFPVRAVFGSWEWQFAR